LGKTLVSLDRTCIRLKADTEDLAGRLFPARTTFRLRRVDTALVVSPHAVTRGPEPYAQPVPAPETNPDAEVGFPLATEWDFVEYL
jgi:hypothetical protein